MKIENRYATTGNSTINAEPFHSPSDSARTVPLWALVFILLGGGGTARTPHALGAGFFTLPVFQGHGIFSWLENPQFLCVSGL